MEVNNICCHKEMKELVIQSLAQMGMIYESRFICLECGSILDISRLNLDDEELLNLLESEELTNTPIYKELKGGLK